MIGNSEETGLICFAPWFTFHGLRLRPMAAPVYATRFTFYGLRFAVYGCAGQFNITTIKLFI